MHSQSMQSFVLGTIPSQVCKGASRTSQLHLNIIFEN